MKKILLAFVFSCFASSAFAACTDPLVVKDGNGTSQNMSVKTGADTNCQTQIDVDTSSNLYGALTSPPTLGSASGGWTPVAKNAIAGTAVAVLSAGAHQMGFALCDNNNAAWTYLQFLDSASPTVGTNVGFLPIPPNTNTGFALALVGIQFSTQMQVAATTTPNGTTAPGTAINCTFGTH